MSEPLRLVMEGFDGRLRVSPPLFIENKTHVDPSDLNQFAPHGNGVYGYQKGMESPFKTAPPQGDKGGYLHFGNNVSREDFTALMAIIGVQERWVVNPQKQYAVFHQESGRPMQDGYLAQMRLVSRFALSSLFGAIEQSEYESYPEQELTMQEALWGFMENERKKYGMGFGGKKLAGTFGGDGDFAQEELCFGLMVENDYFGVYRIWSRAWLVTK